MVKKYRIIAFSFMTAVFFMGAVRKNEGESCVSCKIRKKKAEIGRDPRAFIGGMGQGAVAARGILVNAHGVPTNIIAASIKATPFNADLKLVEQLKLYLQHVPAPLTGTTYKEEQPSKHSLGGKDYYFFFKDGQGHIVLIEKYIPYRLVGTVWQPWPQFWVLWPWWWGSTISPALPYSCYDCEKMGCPYDGDCPPECSYCEI